MKLRKVPQKTLRQRIYDQLREKIVNAAILPGQIIHIRDLAREFGVSTMPVREALWQLESEKAIVIESNKNIRVNTLTAKEMEEALRIRIILESLAAERSCEFYPNSIIPKIKAILEEMEASVGRPKRYMIKNSQFHLTIYSCADSPMLLHIINWLWARVGPHLAIQATKVDLSQDLEYHQEMFEAFKARDKERLTKALRADLEEAARFIVPYLGKSRAIPR